MAMTGIPSIGDVLLLSQLAWRIGCAFTAGRPAAPPEFHEVENELKTLTKSLDLLAEALDDDNSILASADDKVKVGVNQALLHCQQCLEDLNAFVIRYQEVKRPAGEVGTRGLQGVRTWKPALLKSWKSIWWMAEGGNIQETMVTQLNEVHNLAGSAMNARMEEIHRLMADMVNKMGTETDSFNYPPAGPMDRRLDQTSSTEDLTSYEPSHTRASSTGDSSDGYRLESNVKFSADVTQKPSPKDIRGRSARSQPDTDPGPPLSPRGAHDQRTTDSNDYRYISETAPEATGAQLSPARANMYGETPESPSSRQYAPSWNSQAYPTPLLDRTSSQVSSEYSLHETLLLPPPSDMSIEPKLSHTSEIGDPALKLNRSASTASQQEAFKRQLLRDTAILCEVPAFSIEYAQQKDDGDAIMVKATANCQVMLLRKREVQPDGTVKFITSVWGISDDRSVRMEQKLPDGEEVIPYTVWDATLKVSLRAYSLLRFYGPSYVAETLNTAPTNWVNYIFKDEQGQFNPMEDSKTAFYAPSEITTGANLFQSALMGKTLLLSVRTNRVLRVHEGIAGTFAYQEQMCALENLRIWKDQDSNGVIAMIHYTPHFRDGYMSFYLNSQRDRVRISDAGDRHIKLKGLNISIEKPSHRRGPSASNTASSSPIIPSDQQQSQFQQPPSPLQRRNSIGEIAGGSVASAKSTGPTKASKPPKKVTSARLEFTAEVDKRLFLEKFREVQGFFYAE
ncbi:hypothetical protein FGG08_001432 [Glutinoglossum americanum]|uniref:Fungal N-terminal domain-containing protein n=1 Tax=Glutinoglossum americanum TaxID=1670608 RepID=A0A9P8L2R3_9PEZI|nr:hypothetical protein FGG08_001432 [Glutinoglossum americanum]